MLAIVGQGAPVMNSSAEFDLASVILAWTQSDKYIDMTFRQVALLASICDDPGPHYVRELARRLHISTPVVTRIADKFASLGLARRVQDPADGRSILIEPTARGRSIRKAMTLQRAATIKPAQPNLIGYDH
jgi:DNA-binding MarR family transcriptional regulator